MATDQLQKGYVTVLLLGSIGMTILGLGVMANHDSGKAWQPLWADAMQLNDERNWLIYYSIDYANLYGYGSAGPGHLPCPDTDEGSERPGPNPPCGNAVVAVGKLPGGVNRSVGRIAFTDLFTSRTDYVVARALINNPALDVNSSAWPSEHDFADAENGYVALSRPSGQTRILDKSHLKNPVHLWVRAWLVSQLLKTQFRHCEKRSAQLDAVSTRPQPLEKVVAVCQLTDESSLLGLETSECDSSLARCSLEAMPLIYWMLGTGANDWQGVPITHHWFVDNGWSELANLQWEPQCARSQTRCMLVVSNDMNVLGISLIADN